MGEYDNYYKAKEQLAIDKAMKKSALEKQLKVWQDRQKQMRKIGHYALDPAFYRRHLDKCEQEIARISESLSKL